MTTDTLIADKAYHAGRRGSEWGSLPRASQLASRLRALPVTPAFPARAICLPIVDSERKRRLCRKTAQTERLTLCKSYRVKKTG